MPTGVVDPFFTTMRPTTDLVDCKNPFAEDEGGKDHRADAAYEMIERLRNFIKKDEVKA